MFSTEVPAVGRKREGRSGLKITILHNPDFYTPKIKAKRKRRSKRPTYACPGLFGSNSVPTRRRSVVLSYAQDLKCAALLSQNAIPDCGLINRSRHVPCRMFGYGAGNIQLAFWSLTQNWRRMFRYFHTALLYLISGDEVALKGLTPDPPLHSAMTWLMILPCFIPLTTCYCDINWIKCLFLYQNRCAQLGPMGRP
jgi:hypothetical protein